MEQDNEIVISKFYEVALLDKFPPLGGENKIFNFQFSMNSQVKNFQTDKYCHSCESRNLV